MAGAFYKEDGWGEVEDSGFISHVGPFYSRVVNGELEVAAPTDERHRNRFGIVHGGLISTVADRALGMASRRATAGRAQATVKLEMTFIDRVEVGDVILARPKIQRKTSSLTFGHVEMFVGDRLIGTASAVFKYR